MSFFSRVKNIIRSNINAQIDKFDGNVESFDNFEYEENFADDFKEYVETPKEEPQHDIEREYSAILEVRYGADLETIKKSYKKLLKKYHPDLYHNKPEKFDKAQKLTEKLNEAYSYFEKKYE